MSSDKKAKIFKKWNSNKYVGEKKNCHLVPKVVTDLPFEGRLKKAGKIEDRREFQRQKGRNPHRTYISYSL